jgi:hypothetical protein
MPRTQLAQVAAPPLTTVTTEQSTVAYHLANTIVTVIAANRRRPGSGIVQSHPPRLRLSTSGRTSERSMFPWNWQS